MFVEAFGNLCILGYLFNFILKVDLVLFNVNGFTYVRGFQEGNKKVLNFLKLEYQVVVRIFIWVFNIEFWFFEGRMSVIDY